MTFTTYEELMAAVEERRKDTLTLEVDLGSAYSVEHEDAKRELAQAKGVRMLTGGQGFLADNVEELEAKVAATKPPARSVWLRFARISLADWALLMKQSQVSPVDQYEKVLPKVFVGLYGQDPDETPEGEECVPLSTDSKLVSMTGDNGILPGGALHQVIQTFMAWQNTGGEVTIRPTR